MSHLETTAQAAKRLQVHPRTLLRWLQGGKVPGVQTPGGHWRVDPERLPELRQDGPGSCGQANPAREFRVLIIEDKAHHAAAVSRLLRLLAPTARVVKASDGLTGALLPAASSPIPAAHRPEAA